MSMSMSMEADEVKRCEEITKPVLFQQPLSNTKGKKKPRETCSMSSNTVALQSCEISALIKPKLCNNNELRVSELSDDEAQEVEEVPQ
jgi:hypothetical protein